MSEDLKVVIAVKGTRASVAVQAPNCDPVFTVGEHMEPLDWALATVPGLVEEARRRWAESPHYPKYDRPTPPPQGQRPAARPAGPELRPMF